VLYLQVRLEICHVLDELINGDSTSKTFSPERQANRPEHEVVGDADSRSGTVKTLGNQRLDLVLVHNQQVAPDAETRRLPENEEPKAIYVNHERDLAQPRRAIASWADGKPDIRISVQREAISGE